MYDYATALTQLNRKAQQLEALKAAALAEHAPSPAPSTLNFVRQNRGSLGALLLLYLGATTGIIYSAYASQQLKEDEAQYLAAKQLLNAQKDRLQERKVAALQRLAAAQGELHASRHLWLESSLRARLQAALSPQQQEQQQQGAKEGSNSREQQSGQLPARQAQRRVVII